MNVAVDFADAFNIVNRKASQFKNPAQFEIWSRAVDRVDEPLHPMPAPGGGKLIGEVPKGCEDTFATPIEMDKFDQERIVA